MVQPNGRVLVPLVPSSCCRVPSTDCGHLAWLQANRSWAGLKPEDSSLLYTTGCATAIADIFVIDLMICRLLVLAVAALQVLMLVGTRYVWSATYNGILLGRPRGAAPGWLMAGFGTGVLLNYDRNCGDGDTQNVENQNDKKYKWRCIDKLRGRGGKEADNGERDRSRSPCIDKIKQKLRRRSRPKQNVESKTNLNEETEDSSKDEEDIYNITPKRFAQGKNKLADNTLSNEKNETLPLLRKHQNVGVFDVEARQKSPFIDTKAQLKNQGNSRFLQKLEIVKPKVGSIQRSSNDTESEKDFQKTRNLFEKVARRVSPRTFHAKKQTQQQQAHVNVMEFKDSPKSKLEPEQETKILLEDNYSPRSEPDSLPVVLRNYRIPPNV